MGDSSGGNFAFSCQQWLIESGLYVPRKLILIYPVAQLRCFEFSPSVMLTLNETMLTHTLIDIVFRMYLNENRDLIEDPYVSPLLIHP